MTTQATAANAEFAGRHSHDSPEWYTPVQFIEAAREVMGGIDLDPASHEEANRVVQATHYFTEEDDGLKQRWFGCVFLNPPGGLVNEFWQTLDYMRREGLISQAIWIGYSLEQLQTLQNVTIPSKHPLDFPICIPRQRIAFVENEAKKAARLAKIDEENAIRAAQGLLKKRRSERSSPPHANYITYIGSNTRGFEAVFSQFGRVRI